MSCKFFLCSFPIKQIRSSSNCAKMNISLIFSSDHNFQHLSSEAKMSYPLQSVGHIIVGLKNFHLKDLLQSPVHLYATAESKVFRNSTQIFTLAIQAYPHSLTATQFLQENSSRCAFFSFKAVHQLFIELFLLQISNFFKKNKKLATHVLYSLLF